jgi:hypothetical protein
MYTSFTLTFYVVDNNAPYAPQNPALSSATGQNSNVKVSWTANSEADIDYYEVWRKISQINSNWYLIGTSTNSYFIDYEYLYTNPVGDFGLYYKVRAKDINSNYSNYSSEVFCRAEGANKKSFATGDAFEYLLSQNFPNPFNPSTEISYKLFEDGFVNITVYNTIGQEVALLVNQYQLAGKHVIQFKAENLPSGIYIYKLQSGSFTDVKKMILTK